MAEILAYKIFSLTVSTWITIASISYQIVQARKMKKAAQAAAEARKGYELVVEGEGVTLPIVYGRAKVGGVRSYHNVANNYVYTTPNSDKAITNPGFNNNINGENNEFLFFQQALCQGPISNVYDVVYDESRYSDDPDLNSSATTTYDNGDAENPNIYTETKLNSGTRIDLHYGDSAIADSVMSANNPERVNSVFTQVKNTVGIAYASVVVKLDRDNPAFNGVPMLQFFIEGKKIKNIIRSGTIDNYTYSLTPTSSYSNNSALCLLDYLLDKTSGKGMDISLIDLESFYNAKVICDQVVLQDALVGGKIYFPTDGSSGAEGITPLAASRDVRLYECNAIIDTQKPLRENVEIILSTMGDARLVWSGGKYKLNLQYPANNEAITIAANLTDSDLILDNTVNINWPSSSERLNQCTVRFHNESENFKEDTVSWPPKVSGTALRGIGGFKYPVAEDKGWPDNTGGSLLKKHAVWSGSGSSFDQTWKFFVKETGTFNIEYTGDNSCIVTVTTAAGTPVFSGSHSDFNTTNTGSFSLTANTEYRIRVQGTDDNVGAKGVAVKISKGAFIFWTTRSENYTSFLTIVNDAAIYNAMKAEDNGLELETDIFADGVTDYYHALAKAEELVRVSRSAFGIQFKYVIKDKFLEPGDFIKLNSTTLNLGVGTDLYLRVNEVKITEEGVCEVNATRFDSTQLAWNVNDNEYIKTPNIYNFVFGTPTNLSYTQQDTEILNSSGRLSWTGVDTSALDSYITYYYIPGNIDVNNQIIWTELGRTTDTTFNLPALRISKTIFGVRALSKAGRLSNMATTALTNLIPAEDALPYAIVLSNDSLTFTCNKDGVPLAGQLPKTVEMYLYRGLNVVPPAEISYSINPVGCNATISQGVVTITAINDQYATIYLTLGIDNIILSKEISLSKAITGATGIGVKGDPGDPGAKYATATLYQWSPTQPGNPNNISAYNWTTGTNSAYAGGNNWLTYISTNPGTSGIQLWTATKSITAAGGTVDTVVDWSSGVTIASITSNGATGLPGLQVARPTVYRWAASLPAGPVGSSTYTWATSSFNNVPTDWNSTIQNPPSPGFTLWAASVNISDSATTTSTQINWTNASIVAISYAGTNGTNGSPGSPGQQGASARICYSKTALTSLASTPSTITTSGISSYPANGSWGADTVWQATPPVISAGESVYQSDGVYDPVTNNTIWNVPYLSALKVGSLSAITTNTGNLTVSGTIKSSTAEISNTTMTGAGAVVYSNGQFAVGNNTNNITYNGSVITLNGQVVVPSNIDTRGLTIKDASGNVIFGSGTNLDFSRITAASGWLNSNISIASNGTLSGAGGGTVTATGINAVQTSLGNAPAGILNNNIGLTLNSNGTLSVSGGPVASGGVTATGINAVQTSLGNAPAGILNSNISLSSNGTLNNAGGGSVTISGLGYSGALDATKNVFTQGVFSSRPTGTDGDVFYATDTFQLYQKISGSWVLSANNTYVDGSGIIRGTSTGAGTTVANSAITISGGAINGIGTGSGTTVANSAITISSGSISGIGTGSGTVVANSEINIVNGALSGIGTGTGTVVANSAIAVSGGNITGIGTGNNTAVANSAISVSGNTINGIGTGNGTAVANSAISIGSDGTLYGAGGGVVTAGGLGAVRTDLVNAPAGILNSNITLGTLGAGGFATLNTITSGNVSTYISGAAIGTAQVGILTAGNIGAGTIDASKIAANTITADKINSGTVFTNSLQVGGSPAVSGTSMTGSGGILNSTGTFALGNSSTNISYNGSQMTLNGNVVATGNINTNAVTTAAYGSYNGFHRWWQGSVYGPLVDTFASISFYANAGDVVLLEATFDPRVNTLYPYIWDEYTYISVLRAQLQFNGVVVTETKSSNITNLGGISDTSPITALEGWVSSKVIRATATVSTSGTQTLSLNGYSYGLAGGFGNGGSYAFQNIVLSAFIRRR
jgi:hypothetical protein